MQQIGRYQIVGELGRGAMGVVYRALDPAIGRTIAIKSIRLSELTDAAERERLKDRLFREAQSAGILSHPNIVTIYDIQEDQGLTYIFMEFVNGPPLEKLLTPGHAPDKNTLFSVLRQTAAALDYAHKRGIVHRDIKPANIMIHEDGTAKITDFGVAKIVSQQMTQTGMMMGTPSYMSPEQIQGTEVTGKADQFSLAVIAFEMLSGEKPFAADNLATLLYRICREEPASAHRLNDMLDPAVDTVLNTALAKNPADRYDTCADFVNALERACNERADWLPLARGSSLSLQTVAMSRREEAGATVAAPPQSVPLDAGETVAAMPAATRPLLREGQPESHLVRNVVLAAAPVILAIGGFLAWRSYSATPAEPPTQQQSQTAPSTPAEPAPEKPAPAVRNDLPAPPAQEPAATQPNSAPPSTEPSSRPPREAAKESKADTSTMPARTPGGVDIITRFLSTPSAVRIKVDNKADLTCTTPCSLPLETGRHTVVASIEGYRDLTRVINLPSDASVSLDLERSFGTLNVVSSPPGATILINGQIRPERTPAVLKLPPGPYRLQVVSGEAKSNEETVNIRDGAVVQRKYEVE